jgi:molybdopterin/thiamine biosynthesis adenylyltransferase
MTKSVFHVHEANRDQRLPQLSEFEEKLFERQMSLPSFGIEAQQRLKAASVFISRVGGLGGTVAMLLARAGVGKLVLAHGGLIEHENLNRMHLAFREHLGVPRMQAFTDTLRRINPDMKLVAVGEHVHRNNIGHLVAEADILVDASPDFEERYCINAEAVRVGKTLVMAAMSGLECYATTIVPKNTPCLSCLYPIQPDGWDVLGFPVIGASSTFIAGLAAMEVVKSITMCGVPLEGFLFYGDLGNNTFSKFNVKRRADCRVCAD